LLERADHPSVPTCLPRGEALVGGQGWPAATAQRREAVDFHEELTRDFH